MRSRRAKVSGGGAPPVAKGRADAGSVASAGVGIAGAAPALEGGGGATGCDGAPVGADVDGEPPAVGGVGAAVDCAGAAGAPAGGVATGFAILSDILEMHLLWGT